MVRISRALLFHKVMQSILQLLRLYYSTSMQYNKENIICKIVKKSDNDARIKSSRREVNILCIGHDRLQVTGYLRSS